MNSLPILFNKLSINSSKNNIKVLEEALTNDIEHLLNDASHSAQKDILYGTLAASSVINFGLPSLGKKVPITIDAILLARHIATIIRTFEPRIVSDSIKVIPIVDKDESYLLSMLFDIHAISYFNTQEFILHIRIALDCSCGSVNVLL